MELTGILTPDIIYGAHWNSHSRYNIWSSLDRIVEEIGLISDQWIGPQLIEYMV
jgi:hypothetical protein